MLVSIMAMVWFELVYFHINLHFYTTKEQRNRLRTKVGWSFFLMFMSVVVRSLKSHVRRLCTLEEKGTRITSSTEVGSPVINLGNKSTRTSSLCSIPSRPMRRDYMSSPCTPSAHQLTSGYHVKAELATSVCTIYPSENICTFYIMRIS